MNRLNRNKSALATQIGIMILALISFGVLYTALNQAASITENFQTTNFGSGVFNPADYLTFVEQLWYFFPIIAVLGCVFWLLNQAKRRANPAEMSYE